MLQIAGSRYQPVKTADIYHVQLVFYNYNCLFGFWMSVLRNIYIDVLLFRLQPLEFWILGIWTILLCYWDAKTIYNSGELLMVKKQYNIFIIMSILLCVYNLLDLELIVLFCLNHMCSVLYIFNYETYFDLR